MRYLAVSVLCVSLACAGGTSSPGGDRGAAAQELDQGPGVASGFPEPDALEELLEEPLPPESGLAEHYRDVDRFELAGPFPDAVSAEPRRGTHPWNAQVDEFVAARAGLVVATESMDCFAREMGRFLAAERGIPGLALQRYAAGRCGVATMQPTFGTAGWSPLPARDEADAVAQVGEQISKQLVSRVVGGPLELGVWLGAGDERVDLVIAMGERHARVDPIPMTPNPDGRIEITGELLRPAESIAAGITHGRYEWAICEAQPGVALPRFHLSCPVAMEDATAWIALEYGPPESLLGRVALSVLARPQGGEARTFERSVYAPPRAVNDAAELPAALLEVLNRIRADAGLRPLALDAAQSEVAGRVAPYYFAGLFGAMSHSISELVALGMMAGWQVDGIVLEGGFTWAWLALSRDVSRMLSDTLDDPGARATLLSHGASRIAIGGLTRFGVEDLPGEAAGADGEYLAMIASTYALFSEATHQRDVEKVRALLASARAARSRKAQGSLDAAAPLASRAAARVQGGEDPRDVLEDLIAEGAEVLQRSVVGWMAETQELETLPFPDDFTEREELDVAIAVPVRKPEGEAWGRYVVLLLAADPPQRRL